jgi:hypothetical protein
MANSKANIVRCYASSVGNNILYSAQLQRSGGSSQEIDGDFGESAAEFGLTLARFYVRGDGWEFHNGQEEKLSGARCLTAEEEDSLLTALGVGRVSVPGCKK